MTETDISIHRTEQWIPGRKRQGPRHNGKGGQMCSDSGEENFGGEPVLRFTKF